MSIELKAGLATAIGAGIILLIALFLWYSSRRKSPAPENDHKRIYELRVIYFFILTVGLTATLGATLQRLPYPNYLGRHVPAMVVKVTGSDWLWKFDSESGPGKGKVTYNRLKVPAGRLIEFRVTSTDVNHGFGIYDADGVLLGQTQAMPGYVNNLYFRFPKPGAYRIECLEYCGVGHQLMHADVRVTEPSESATSSARAGNASRGVGK